MLKFARFSLFFVHLQKFSPSHLHSRNPWRLAAWSDQNIRSMEWRTHRCFSSVPHFRSLHLGDFWDLRSNTRLSLYIFAIIGSDGMYITYLLLGYRKLRQNIFDFLAQIEPECLRCSSLIPNVLTSNSLISILLNVDPENDIGMLWGDVNFERKNLILQSAYQNGLFELHHISRCYIVGLIPRPWKVRSVRIFNFPSPNERIFRHLTYGHRFPSSTRSRLYRYAPLFSIRVSLGFRSKFL